MRRSQPFLLSAILVIFFSVLTSALPWPRWLPDLDALIVRQQGSSSSTNSGTQAPASQTGSVSPSPTDGSASGSITAPPPTDSGSSASASGSSNAGQSTSSTPTTTVLSSYDARSPPGGIAMLTPAPLSGAEYYKVGDFVTFGWNYTSLLGSPSAVNILATCTGNKRLYTIATNQAVTNATQAVIWDTNAYQSANPKAPLLTETYTLIIYDAASSISAVPQAGYLAPFTQFSFGMYTPSLYEGLGDGFQCVTCSSALSSMERKALGFSFGMCAITVLSFTWFVSGVNIIW